eukprot:CAMPEP_0115848074 /NCGR_PEP_ID=MMETSP0287-20121206/10722_1 /TAXON_ID=412157 /ORGANISM="Chrysochromulina rotalis, Strain UIO044" /LENGTH=297 /DNA_ID=CAMNT_0003301951 /DNA_START=27 /DNA_END=920 /DNA_ORIENTATION=+
MSYSSLRSEETGVAAVSAKIYDRVVQYHAQIGAAVPHSELASLEAKLLKEASKECYAQHWEQALHLFTNALAVSEKTKSCADPGTRGTFVHNIGFCLHCLGEFEAAKAYYEQSIDCLERAAKEVPMSTKVVNGLLYPERLVFEAVYGGLNYNRIQMTKERLIDISFNRKPDLKVLDEYGRRKPMPGAKINPMDGRAEPTEQASLSEDYAPPPGYEADRKPDRETVQEPGWLAATQASGGAAADDDAGRDAAEEEAARKEWLEYYMQSGDFDKAEELIVTPEEREDLEYLKGRMRRKP